LVQDVPSGCTFTEYVAVPEIDDRVQRRPGRRRRPSYRRAAGRQDRNGCTALATPVRQPTTAIGRKNKSSRRL